MGFMAADINKTIAVTISSSRSPFEIYMLLACILSGAVGLIDPGRGSSGIAQVLPHWELYFWYGGLIVGGIVTFLAVLSNALNSLYVERIGLTLLSGLSAAYGVAIVANSGYKLALAILFVLAFGIACAFRIRQIGRDLKHIDIMIEREDQK